jgi:hypothetical protein
MGFQPCVCDANEAVTVRFLDGDGRAEAAEHDDGAVGASFHPTYTHQVFNPEETISGYAINASLSLVVSLSRVRWVEQVRRAED